MAREPETRRSVASASTPLNLGAWRTADGTVDVKINEKAGDSQSRGSLGSRNARVCLPFRRTLAAAGTLESERIPDQEAPVSG